MKIHGDSHSKTPPFLLESMDHASNLREGTVNDLKNTFGKKKFTFMKGGS